MASGVEADFLGDAAFLYHLAHPFAYRPIVEIGKYKIAFLERLVAFDYLQGNVQQLHLERHARLVPFGDNPFLTVHIYYLLIGQLLDVHKRQGGETGENENITQVGVLGVFELEFHQRFQFFFRQVFTFLRVRAYVELGKRISRYVTVEVRPHHHAFQPHAVFPYRTVVQSGFVGKEDGELLDEVRSKLRHGHVVPLVT